jgi:hypothetical protein
MWKRPVPNSNLPWMHHLFLILWLYCLVVSVPTALASHTPNPSTVTIAGSLQSELGCAGDWDPACATTHLTYDAGDDVWQGTWTVPAGVYEYKAALNDNWTENYGLHATSGGANIPLTLGANTSVKFYYDHKTHWITDNHNSIIATVPGSFQSELGCPGDWQPDCLRSWLQDADGNGIYSFSTNAIPVGNYECKVAINEGWAENYGQGGTPGGANIPFAVLVPNSTVVFSYDSTTHVLSITVETPVAPPVISKAFGGASIPLNGTTLLTFTITNPSANTVGLTGVAFSDNLPAGLVVATPNGLANSCGGTVTAVAGSGSISLTGGTIATNSNCTLGVNVTGTTSGNFINTTGAVTSTNGGTGSTATASVYVAMGVPTLTGWGIILLMFLLGFVSIFHRKRQRGAIE